MRRGLVLGATLILMAFLFAACGASPTEDTSPEGATAGSGSVGSVTTESVTTGDVVSGSVAPGSRYPDLDGLGLDFHGTPFTPAGPAPDFSLVDQRGNSFRLSDQQGNVVVLFFGYTTCPDVCPTTLLHYRQVKQKLGPDADGVRFVFVTVDPERDTPEQLAGYIARYDASFYGLSGPREQLEQIWDDYDIYVEITEVPDSPVGYWIDHTGHSFVIDADGQLIGLYPFGIPYEYVARDLQRLVGEAKTATTSAR